MDGAFDIPDPSDWLDTPLKDFADLEVLLHCSICKEFFDTPMITSCCHTFCSKCIRTCLSANGKCPSCQAADQASKLRNNWILQTVVDKFVTARPAAIDVARKEQEQAQQAKKPGKRKRAVLDSDDIAEAEQDGRTTRRKSRRIAASQGSQQDVIEIEDSDGDGEFRPEAEPDDGRIECLLGCGKRIKPEEMGAHIDICEDEGKQGSRAKSRTPVNSANTKPPSVQNHRAYEKIGELSYSLLNDTKLRQKLKDAGIPNWGTKQLMVKRHTEWVNLWNANCDSGGKRAKNELLHDLDRWERTQGGRAPNANGLSSTIMRKDFDGAGWANSNKQDFSRLIADAKRRKSNPAVEESRPKDVDMADTLATPEPDVKEESSDTQHPTTSHPQPPQAESPADPARAYENNEEAMSSIRAKVEAANNNQPIEPVMNAEFPSMAVDDAAESLTNHEDPLPGAEHPALLDQHRFGLSTQDSSRDEHVAHRHTGSQCDLPVHLQSNPVKLSMFAVPQRMVSDLDDAGDNAAGDG